MFTKIDEMLSKFDKAMERFSNWEFNKRKKLSFSKVGWRRVKMIFYLIPNLIITIVAILSLGLDLGWSKLVEFPYLLIWIYLIMFGFYAFWIKWGEPKEDEIERQELIDEIAKKVSNSSGIQGLTSSINELISEIKKDRDERKKSEHRTSADTNKTDSL